MPYRSVIKCKINNIQKGEILFSTLQNLNNDHKIENKLSKNVK